MNKKFLILMIMGILLLATVSAFEFDNVGQYDPNTRTMTIVNGFGLGADIATIQLTSSLHEKVPAGYGQVAQFNMAVFDDYNQAFKELELYHRGNGNGGNGNGGNGNGGNGNGQFNRDYEWKFKTTEKTKVDDWVEECYTNQTTGNETCIMVIDGWHWEWLPVWETIHNSDWMEGDVLTVGLFTIVEVNDSVEWIPNFFGVRIDEWATWTASLNTDLVSYWKLNVGSSNQIDSVNSNDGTVDGATYTASGKIGGAYNFDGTNDRINISNDASFNSLSAYSISAWIYRDGTSDDFIFSKLNDFTEHNKNYEFGIESNKIFLLNGNGGGYNKVLGTSTLSSSTWYFVVGVWDGTDIKVYLDGSLDCSPISSTVVSFGTTAIALGTRQTGYAFFDGKIDEVGFWDRALTSTEITQLYNGGTGITYDSLDNDAPIVTQISPANNAKESTTGSKNFTCYGSDDTNFTSMEFYIDGSLNQTNSSGLNNTNYTFTTSLTEETYLWSCLGNDNDGESTSTVNRTLTIDTTPFIEFVSPTFANASNLLVSYIPVNISLTETYFENLTINFYKDGVLNESYFIDDDTRFYNKSGCTCAEWEVNATVWTTTDQSNSTETRIFTIDTISPTLSGANNLIDLLTPTFPVNSTWNYTANDPHIDSCYYNTSDNATYTIITCNASENTGWTTSGQKSIQFCANDTFGNEACSTESIWIVEYLQTDNPDPSVEGFDTTFILNLNATNIPTSTATFNINGSAYSPTTTTLSTNANVFDLVLNIPATFGNTTGVLHDWYWNYTIDGVVSNLSTATENVTVYELAIDDCSTYGELILNFSLNDEELNTLVNATAGSNVEVDLTLTSLTNSTFTLDYSNTWTDDNNPQICIPANVLNNTQWQIDLTVGFSSTDRVWEFWYMDQGTLNATKIYESFNGQTEMNIDLMDLETTESTSFLFNYFDNSGLAVDGAMIHPMRKYIGDGVFREVERAKADQNGDTIVHLVEEDVIYFFYITKNGELLYTSSTYTALCQATPCTIQIEASGSSAVFPTDWDGIDGGGYSLFASSDTRIVNLTYAVDTIQTFNLTVYRYESDGSYSPIDSAISTGTSESIVITVPVIYGNVSLFASVFVEDEFVTSDWIDFSDKLGDRIGTNLALFLASLIILTLGLMAVSSGIGVIVFVILGVAVSGFLGLMTTALSTGISIVIYLIVAGGILLIKLSRGRR